MMEFEKMQKTIEQVVLVDEQDHVIGVEEKLIAHQKALCHRAFSVFIFRQYKNAWQLLLQQRQYDKYHSAGLWTNTCCGHPRPGETILAAGERRLFEEMNIQVKLVNVGVFHYIAPFSNGLTENEVDHVLIGFSNPAVITPNPTEVAAFCWKNIEEINQSFATQTDIFTPWFQQAFQLACQKLT